MESAEEAEHLSNEWEYSLVPGFTASKILWLKNKEPENFARLRKVLLPHDFLNYHLTGRYCMEVNLADIFLNAKPWTAAQWSLSCTPQQQSKEVVSLPHRPLRHSIVFHGAHVGNLYNNPGL